jgi:hypothetical protein
MALYYFDASGFSLDPLVPYALQKRGQPIRLPARLHRQRLNVLGFLGLDNDLQSFCFETSVDTSLLIACFDLFSRQIKKPTVVVLDNGSAQTSRAFRTELPTWPSRGLTLYYLPPYSPALNLIETLWRWMKYQWLDGAAYTDFPSLVKAVNAIVWHKADDYHIQFTE